MLVENQKLNLTAIRERELALTLHVRDSLKLWDVVAFEPQVIVDIGSGNGFPGVAAAVLWPNARTVLVERTQKKAAAIRRCLDDVGLERVETLPVDAAQLPALHADLCGHVNLVTARAMGQLDAALTLAQPLIASAPALVVQWKAGVDDDERRRSLLAARRIGLTPRDDYEYTLKAPDQRTRRLVCFLRM
jgi:16S rRNA (guanine527-N7)-methyltransferase